MSDIIQRTDPAACTNNIRTPALRSKKLHETIDAKKQQVLEMLDTIYLLSVEVAVCDAEMQKVSNEHKG